MWTKPPLCSRMCDFRCYCSVYSKFNNRVICLCAIVPCRPEKFKLSLGRVIALLMSIHYFKDSNGRSISSKKLEHVTTIFTNYSNLISTGLWIPWLPQLALACSTRQRQLPSNFELFQTECLTILKRVAVEFPEVVIHAAFDVLNVSSPDAHIGVNASDSMERSAKESATAPKKRTYQGFYGL